MRRTPEGKVKDRVREIIDVFKPHVYAHWPVLNGMGAPTLDCIGCVDGHFFAVETKAPGEVLTAQQDKTRSKMREAGGTVFAIDEVDSPAMAEFEAWVHHHVMNRIEQLRLAKRSRK